ncbi:MAG TPA: transcriptional repressor [Candidatus Omnitrophota bacterium]|nr:transcriptional repressor [Candidatus Omnitrophota bacterium]
MEKEIEIFERHVQGKGLKHSNKRQHVLKTFLNSREHLSAEDLFQRVKQQHPAIGYTTVYRAIKLIVESGIAEMVDFNDGVKRFERKIGREYHAHFICTKCGNHFEVFDKNIEGLSSRLAEHQGFLPQKHRLEIFGLCRNCG